MSGVSEPRAWRQTNNSRGQERVSCIKEETDETRGAVRCQFQGAAEGEKAEEFGSVRRGNTDSASSPRSGEPVTCGGKKSRAAGFQARMTLFIGV